MTLLKVPHSLRWHLFLLAFAAMVPFFVFSSVIATWLVGDERALAEHALLRASRELSLNVDQEMETATRTLQAIAAAEGVHGDDLRQFHQELIRVLSTQSRWAAIRLHAPNLKLVASTALPFGAPVEPAPEVESLRRLFATGQPAIGALKLGPRGNYGFAVRVPVFAGKRVAYALSAVILTSAMQQLVSDFAPSVPEEWTRTVIDPRGTIVARSRQPERFIGRPARPSYMALLDQNPQGGLERRISLDGQATYMTYYRSPVTHWSTAIAVPVKTLDASTDRASALVLLFGFLLLATFGTLAFVYSRMLARRIESAAEGAAALAMGRMPAIEPSSVSEVERLRVSLMSAAELLRTREDERNENLARADAARDEAERASRTKSEFLANMSHELRTPLGVILGALDLHESPEIGADEKALLLGRTRRNAEYLSTLIDQVLDLSKIEADALEIEVRPFSPRELVEDVVASLRITAHAKGVELRFEPSPALPTSMRSDPLRARQILINVVGNAVKFTNEGEVTVRASASEDRTLEIRVEDTGVGMSPESRERLFRPFFQADNSMTRRFGGTGLGLAVSRKFARALGGDVELVRSEPGQGSTFRIRIRDFGAPLVAARPSAKPAPLGAPEKPLAGLRVLLVDDSADNRFLIQRMLTLAGAEVTTAEDGRRGVEAALAADYDCVLMDIQMPVLDGNQATAELRARGYERPIAALTAHAMRPDRERAMNSGYDDYLTKPVDKTLLIAAVLSLGRRAPVRSC